MKAIANEIYYDHSKTYEAVSVVNRRACENNKKITLLDFRGHRSCHGGSSTAAGWNYPINYIKNLINNEKLSDSEIGTHERGLYASHSGDFRCLVEELGHIAFVKGDTALFYSMQGRHSQLWSTKSVRDFMYLCPQRGLQRNQWLSWTLFLWSCSCKCDNGA